MKEKNCFIICPIGEEDSETRKRSDKVLADIIEPSTIKCGYKAIRADKLPDPGIITHNVIKHILNDSLVIADLTEQNPNVFYELALRHVSKKPLVQIIDKSEEGKIPFDVANMSTILIDLQKPTEAQEKITAQIQEYDKTQKIETPIPTDVTFRQKPKKKERRDSGLFPQTGGDILSDMTHTLNTLFPQTSHKTGGTDTSGKP